VVDRLPFEKIRQNRELLHDVLVTSFFRRSPRSDDERTRARLMASESDRIAALGSSLSVRPVLFTDDVGMISSLCRAYNNIVASLHVFLLIGPSIFLSSTTIQHRFNPGSFPPPFAECSPQRRRLCVRPQNCFRADSSKPFCDPESHPLVVRHHVFDERKSSSRTR